MFSERALSKYNSTAGAVFATATTNMAGFSGFTDEEIRRFKTQGEDINYGENTNQEPIKKAAINAAGKRSRPREKIRTKSSNSKRSVASSKEQPTDAERNDIKQQADAKQEESVLEESKVEQKSREIEVVMEPEKVKELELSNLEKMQQKQKEMEKINKKKERMLQTALKQRYAKTKKETETLKLVQSELSRLDNLLYTDVQILRDKIDHACREFDAARKRYDRAEAEFVNAKMNLHDKTETKDQLTEHLCSIIQQNEERKAKKLAELMDRLEMADQVLNLETIENSSENNSSTLCTETNSAALAEKIIENKIGQRILTDVDKKSNTIPESKLEVDVQNNNKKTDSDTNVKGSVQNSDNDSVKDKDKEASDSVQTT